MILIRCPFFLSYCSCKNLPTNISCGIKIPFPPAEWTFDASSGYPRPRSDRQTHRKCNAMPQATEIGTAMEHQEPPKGYGTNMNKHEQTNKKLEVQCPMLIFTTFCSVSSFSFCNSPCALPPIFPVAMSLVASLETMPQCLEPLKCHVA